MFGIFKRKKRNNKVSIADKIRYALNHGETGLHINIYIDDQILFQIVPAKNYGKRGLKDEELNGFIEIHFFNKNKTLTKNNEQFAKELSDNGHLTYFEGPKGIHNYIQAIGKNPDEIESVINERISTIYSNIEKERISMEFVGY